MAYCRKILTEVAAYTLGGRVGVIHVRMLLLKCFELMHQVVEFLIGNCGPVQHIVIVIVCVQLLP